jgi:N-acetyl-anhydromuramyl-L-alanine amidase AmpD
VLAVDENGWLKTDAEGDPEFRMVPSPRHSPLAGAAPLAPVWHTTDVATPAARSAAHWSQPVPAGENPASAHVIIGRDGVIYQCVPFLLSAWHTRGPGLVAGVEVEHVNHCTVGIELENIGEVKRFTEADDFRFQAWPYYRASAGGGYAPGNGLDPALRVDPARVATCRGRWYDGFTPPQLAAAEQLLRALAARYGWRRKHCGRGHVDYEPARKQDPWPLFHDQLLPGILDRVFPQAVA